MKADLTKIEKASGNRVVGWQTIYGYQSQVWLWRLRFHIFHKEDPGEAYHDHPWNFWTFPLTSYVEDVLNLKTGEIKRQVVPRFRWSFRDAEHTHRIIGKHPGTWSLSGDTVWNEKVEPDADYGRIYTIVIRGPVRRAWNYVNVSLGKVHRIPWKAYLRKADPTSKVST